VTQANFSQINDVLRSRRDSMTDEVVERMLAGYTFVNDALKNRVDLLHRQHRNRLLELKSALWP
jgi:type VI protein secretion system component VasA